MRPDGKVEGPRQSMSWLHTWSSLILGWLLYAIFLTGTLSFFQNEISTWMKPELHQSIPALSQAEQTHVAIHYLQHHHADAGSWNIQLPNSRQNVTQLTVRTQDEDPTARRGGTRITIDSATGEVLNPRETRGGAFLYRFHFELYGMPRLWTRWLVGIATLLMLIGLITGVITHKKIFQDFFTFRPAKGQRSWLDAHNATAVLALPFHFMITFSGLLLLMFMLMPWGIKQIYENPIDFLKDHNKLSLNVEQREQQGRERNGQSDNIAIEQGAQAATLTDLRPMIAQVQQHWGSNPIGHISIVSPNTTQATIELRALNAKSIVYRGLHDNMKFDGISGKQITNQMQPLAKLPVSTGIYNVVTVLHEARGLDLALRWLLFLSGVVGTLMIATGLILWTVKRAPQQQKQGFKSFGYRLVEVANIAAIIGLCLACAAYFYANRLIPTDIELRQNWEIRSFFAMWLLTLIYACLRSNRQAWLELLGLAVILFAALPLLNAITGGQALWNSIAYGQWVIATFDLAMWFIAACFAFTWYSVKKHKAIPPKKAKPKLQAKAAVTTQARPEEPTQ